MKSIIFSLLFTLLFAACALAESYIIEYPESTSDRYVTQARRIVTDNVRAFRFPTILSFELRAANFVYTKGRYYYEKFQ